MSAERKGIDVMKAVSAATGASQHSKANGKELGGAAAVGAAAGLMVAGPNMAVVGALAAGIAAATDQGDAGNVARATGRTATAAFEKAKAFDQEHHVTEKVKDVAVNAVSRAKALDQEYHIMEKAKEDARLVMNAVKEFNEKHHVTDKVAQGVVQGLDRLNNFLKEAGDKDKK